MIDTNQYAGSFERPMCAYVTGSYSECQVGEKFASIALSEIPKQARELEFIIDKRPDDSFCHRPVGIIENPNHDDELNSVSIYFHTKPNSELFDLMKQRAQKFVDYICTRDDNSLYDKIVIEGYRFLEEKVVVTYDEISMD